MAKDKKKLKKKRSKSRKHKQISSSSNSNDSGSSGEEWVEADAKSEKLQCVQQKIEVKSSQEKDDWLNNPALFACVSREEIKQSKEKKKDKNEYDKYMLDKLGQTDRELNPYWKHGGTGLPSEAPVLSDSLKQASVTVGDQGVAWLRKALQRAKEQSIEQRRSLEEVVSERWGSLDKLQSMIAVAEEREKNTDKYNDRCSSKYRSKNLKTTEQQTSKTHSYDRPSKNSSNHNASIKFAKPEGSNSSDDDKYKYKYDPKDKKQHKKQDSKSTSSSDDSEYSKKDNSKHRPSSKEGSQKKKFFKPQNSSSEDECSGKHYPRSKYYKDKISSRTKSCKESDKYESSSDDEIYYSSAKESKYRKYKSEDKSRIKNKDSSSRKFVKPNYNSDEDSSFARDKSSNVKSFSKPSGGGWRKKMENKAQEEESVLIQKSEKVKIEEARIVEMEPILTDKEMNDLGAKLVKAELLGNTELAEQLKAKLERAREVKASKPKEQEIKEEVVILTHTDSRGFTRPVSLSGPLEPTGGRRKAKKVETHSDGKRMRYFADDDKYSLQEMFQREKLCTVEDSNEVFAKLASKGVGRDDSTRDMDDVFEETARMEEADGHKQVKERHRAIEESKRVARSLDNCQWCLESQKMLKHLIVAIGSTCYLCVPPYQSLTENHCLIVPNRHTPCATQLDEDVWRELQDFRKAVVKMFLSHDEDVVFFESARHINKFPHMVMNCIPVPKEIGDMAPIYFKKAIQECEMEWSNNKKLVDLRGKDVRRAVPKGLPYFAVDFGLESGFAHVIEDEQLFPQNFAQEIIGGMLDLDHTIWRKQRRQSFEEQSKKVIRLTKMWSQFDCTKNK